MKKQEFYFKSKDNETNIHMIMFEPDTKVNAILQIIHGETEHMGMYKELAEYYTRAGIAITGIDLIGHGMSTNNGAKKMTFGKEGSSNYVIEDINTCFDYVKKLHPDVPYILMGISFGAILARSYLINYPRKVDGVILIGNWCLSTIKLNSLNKKVQHEIKKNGENAPAIKMKKRSIEKWNKRLKSTRTPYDYLLKSNETLDKFITDPLKGQTITNSLVREIIKLIRYVQNPDNIKKMDTNKPILILSGEHDVATNYGEDSKKIYNEFKNYNVFDVTSNRVEGCRHDIMLDDNRYQVYDYIYGWIHNKMFRGLPVGKDEVLTQGVKAVVQIQDKVLKAAKEQQKRNNDQ